MFSLVLVCLSAVLFGGAFCKHHHETRVIGGDVVDILSYKYIVSVQNDGGHVCGGAIIAPHYILTAAHCVYGISPGKLQVRAGSPMVASGGVLRNVSAITTHPNYVTSKIDNNIAVLKLDSTLPYGTHIGFVSLPGESEGAPTLRPGYASGWGTETGLQSQLRSVWLQTFPVCWINNAQYFCAGCVTMSKGVCKYDEGGPYVLDGKLYGIAAKVNTGILKMNCYTYWIPSVFLKVSLFRSFISSVAGV